MVKNISIQVIVAFIFFTCLVLSKKSAKEALNKIKNVKEDSCLVGQPMVTYVDSITQWWPPQSIAKGLGVPDYAPENDYNVFILAFWLSSGAADASLVFAKASTYFSTESVFGSTNDEIQKNIARKFHEKGKTILVSAFGATEFPTSAGADPIQTAQNIAQFVLDNNFDGVDLDWEDNAAMENGTGEQWLIDCTKELRKHLPVGKYILTHAPQGPYFTGQNKYQNGGYLTINQQVGDLIDWYNIQFYNQGDNRYDSYESLFEQSGGYFANTAIQEMIAAGVDPNKIVIGKPVTQADVVNSGLVDPRDLGVWAKDFYFQTAQCFGVMTWQYSHDQKGLFPEYYTESFNNK